MAQINKLNSMVQSDSFSERLHNLFEEVLKLERLSDLPAEKQIRSETRLLQFTKREVKQMPLQFRKAFQAQGGTAHVKKRIDGNYNISYEVSYAKKPYNVTPIKVTRATLKEAKTAFIKAVQAIATPPQ